MNGKNTLQSRLDHEKVAYNTGLLYLNRSNGIHQQCFFLTPGWLAGWWPWPFWPMSCFESSAETKMEPGGFDGFSKGQLWIAIVEIGEDGWRWCDDVWCIYSIIFLDCSADFSLPLFSCENSVRTKSCDPGSYSDQNFLWKFHDGSARKGQKRYTYQFMIMSQMMPSIYIYI